jgi:hypothetical protein
LKCAPEQLPSENIMHMSAAAIEKTGAGELPRTLSPT